MQRGLYWCRNCDYQASVTAGTLFHDTHKPLRLWFEAMWYVTNQKSGVSALGLQRVLGLGRIRQLSHSLELAAQASASHGTAWARPTHWRGGGR